MYWSRKNSRRVPVAILRKSALVEKEIIIQLGSGTSVIEELSAYFFGLQNCDYVSERFFGWAGLPLSDLISNTPCLISRAGVRMLS